MTFVTLDVEEVGTTGVGIVSDVSQMCMKMKTISGISGRIVVTDDTLNGTVDLNISESSLDHNNILNVGTNTHTQIDSHISATDNPHEVTAAQVGAADPLWNALKIQDITVSSDAPSDGQVLVYRASGGKYEPEDMSAEGVDEDTTSSFFDDFITSDISRIWNVDLAGVGSDINVVEGIGGNVELTTGSAIGNSCVIKTAFPHTSFASGCDVKFRHKVVTPSNSIHHVGLYSASGDCVEFYYDSLTSSNWVARTKKSGISTVVNCTLSDDSQWHIFRIVLSSVSAKFYIDGSLETTITSNITLNNLFIYTKLSTSVGSSKQSRLDFVKYLGGR